MTDPRPVMTGEDLAAYLQVGKKAVYEPGLRRRGPRRQDRQSMAILPTVETWLKPERLVIPRSFM